MNESDARRVVLVRAIELADPERRVWTREDRRHVSAAALSVPGADADPDGADREAAFLARRAALACAMLERAHPEVARARRSARWPRWLWWTMPLVAFVLGVAANELNAERRINIVSFPLLGMLAWNVAVYALMVADATLGRGRRGATAAAGPITAVLSRLVHAHAPAREAQDPLARGLSRFRTDWLRFSARLNGARARAALHLGAAALAAGAIAGLYVRGLAFEYRAGWESTFLDEHAVHWMLAIVLGPASTLTGIGLPGPAEIAALRWPQAGAGANAAPWIHLYASTAALFIIAPRLALAAWCAWLAGRLRQRFLLPIAADAYLSRLASAGAGLRQTVRVVPYSYHPDARTRQAVQDLFAEALGEAVDVGFDQPVAYGAEDDFTADVSATDGRPADCVVALFNIAATPEDENHGVFVERLQRAVDAPRARTRLVAVLNETPLRQRLAGQASLTPRLAERRAAWETLLRARGVHVIPLEVDAGDLGPAARRLDSVLSGAAVASPA